MSIEMIISRSCEIAGNTIIADGKPIYHDPKEDKFENFSILAYRYFGWEYPKFFKMDHLCKLGFITSEILLNNKHFLKNHLPENTAVIVMNTSSSLDTDLNYNATISNKADYFPSPALFVYTLPNILIGEICIRNGIKGENAFFVTEKFDPEFLYTYVSDLFQTSGITSCICGWVDIIREDYKSLLIFVERKNSEVLSENQTPFVPSHIDRIFTAIHERIN